MYNDFCLFPYVFFLVLKLVILIPPPCLIYYKDQRRLPRRIPMGDAVKVCSGFWICTWASVFFSGCAAICHCLFCKYYFNVVHVCYVMKNTPSYDIFYCIIILKAICYVDIKMKFEKRVISKNVS